MNLTIHLNEQRIDPKTGRISGGYSTFENIKALKIEYSSVSSIEYKVEIIMFIGEKYNKQLITINNLEKDTAIEISKKLHMHACLDEGSMEEVNNVGSNIVDRIIRIHNKMKTVDITSEFYCPNEGQFKGAYRSGRESFTKLNPVESDNPGADYNETWRRLPEVEYKAFMSILNSSNKWKGDLEAIKHNTKISCDKIWEVKISKEDQIQCAVDDFTIDPRYIMEIYGGLNGHGDWETYLDGLRTYVKCIKRMPGVNGVNLLETNSDIPDDVFRALIVIHFDSKKGKKKDVREEIDYRELV